VRPTIIRSGVQQTGETGKRLIFVLRLDNARLRKAFRDFRYHHRLTVVETAHNDADGTVTADVLGASEALALLRQEPYVLRWENALSVRVTAVAVGSGEDCRVRKSMAVQRDKRVEVERSVSNRLRELLAFVFGSRLSADVGPSPLHDVPMWPFGQHTTNVKAEHWELYRDYLADYVRAGITRDGANYSNSLYWIGCLERLQPNVERLQREQEEVSKLVTKRKEQEREGQFTTYER
jgi:hypothetical protein